MIAEEKKEKGGRVFNEMAGSGEDNKRERKRDKVLRGIRYKSRNKSSAMGACSEVGRTERGQRAVRLVVAELTYIDFTENNVYYAANHNQGVEHVPGIPKIALSEAE